MIDIANMTVKQRLAQFDAKHGDDAVVVSGWLVFSNGAMREVNPLGAMCEPPADYRELCKIQLHYREELLRRAVQNFSELKRNLLLQAQANLSEGTRTPPPPCDQTVAVQQLEALQQTVKDCQQSLAETRERLENGKPSWLRAREAEASVNKTQNAQFIAALAGINV